MNFNKYPYTDFHEMNQDFLLKKIGELEKAVEEKSSDIDDSTIALNKTWSSSKIKNEIDDSKITVDSQLSDTSTNPVQNRVIKDAIDNINVDVATVEKAGIVKPDGTTVTIENDGTVHAVQTPATPIATVDTAGKVKPDGTSILIESDGTIHTTGGSGASMWSEIIDKPFEDIGSDFKTETVEDVELLKLSDAVSAKMSKLDSVADGDDKDGEVTQKLATIPKIVGGDVWTPKAYTKGDTCIYNNVVYVAIMNTDASITPTNTTYWKPISLKELNDGLPSVTETQLIPYSTEGVTIIDNGSKWIKYGNVVTLYFQIYVHQSRPTWNTIFVPQDPSFLPSASLSFMAWDNSHREHILTQLTSALLGGNVSFGRVVESSEIRGIVTYIV